MLRTENWTPVARLDAGDHIIRPVFDGRVKSGFHGKSTDSSGFLHGSWVNFKPLILAFKPPWKPLVFCGSVLVQDTSEPQPIINETQNIHQNASCCFDFTNIMLKVV